MSKKEDPYDGCGVGIASTSKKDPFYESCRWHDATYSDGSIWQDKYSRETIDKHFLQQMLLIAGDSYGLKMRAYLYYGLARLFGSRLWEGNK